MLTTLDDFVASDGAWMAATGARERRLGRLADQLIDTAERLAGDQLRLETA